MDGLGPRPTRSPRAARAFGAEVLLGELIGRGGMSRVYRGRLRADGREVAVKVLREDLAGRPEAVQRFVRERDLLAAVASPHVVRVHDLVVDGDELGIVMDLVAGGHLRRAVSFPCPPAEAAELTAQIADGLGAVHAAGVIHRDLKPENVLVDSDGAGGVLLRLTDFGISRLVDAGTLTQTTVTGTPGYLSPEVAAGGRVTAAADIYALGVVLYELCAGRGPFLADNPLVLILAATRRQAPRPGGMPEALWELLAAMLAKDPAARPTAAAAAVALRALVPSLSGLPVCTAPPPSTDTDLVVDLTAGPVPAEHGGGEPGDSGSGQVATGRIGLWQRRRVLVAAGAGVAVLGVVSLIGMGVLPGRRGGVVVPVPVPALSPTMSNPRPRSGASTLASTSTAFLRTIHPRVVVSVAPADLPPARSVSSASVTLESASSPGVPTLARLVASPADQHSSDQLVKLMINGVTAGAGTVASITVSYGSRVQQVPVGLFAAATYQTTVGGLTNGTPYVFTVKVCNTIKLCTTSQAFSFTPYGAPEVQAPRLTVKGLTVSVQVAQIIRHSNPGQTVCTVSVMPADAGTPQKRSVAPGGETFTFAGRSLTSYVAAESCATGEISDGTALSNLVVTGQVAPTPSLTSLKVSPAPPEVRSDPHHLREVRGQPPRAFQVRGPTLPVGWILCVFWNAITAVFVTGPNQLLTGVTFRARWRATTASPRDPGVRTSFV